MEELQFENCLKALDLDCYSWHSSLGFILPGVLIMESGLHDMFLICELGQNVKIFPGFCIYSGIIKSTDQEIIAIEKIVCLLTVLKSRGHAPQCRATQGSTRVGQEAEIVRDSIDTSFFVCIWFLWKGQTRQGKLI